MKKVLILVISSQNDPYLKMMETSLATWDSIEVKGVETVFYCGNPVKENTDKIIYFPIEETLHTMGEKTLLAYDWALKNKEFDYIARVNASTHVNKKELIKYIQTLPETNVFAGLKVEASVVCEQWMWGPQFIMSKDIIELIVKEKERWDHSKMDDQATSFLLNKFNVPYTQGRMCSIEKKESKYWVMCYGSESMDLNSFEDINKLDNQFFIRCKMDHDRNEDLYLMNEIFKALK